MNIIRNCLFAILLWSAAGASTACAETTKWGAIAVDTQKAEKQPAWGTGGAETEQEAIDIAVKFCTDEGGAVCKAIVSYQQCGALAVDGKGEAGWGKAPTKADAEKQALSGCGAGNCAVVTSDCNAE